MSLVSRKTISITTRRYHWKHFRITEIKFKGKATISRTGKDEKQLKLSYMAGGSKK